jgi:hypothetical protein
VANEEEEKLLLSEEIELSVGELFEARRYVSLLSDAQKEQLREGLSEKRFNELFEDEKAD